MILMSGSGALYWGDTIALGISSYAAAKATREKWRSDIGMEARAPSYHHDHFFSVSVAF